MELDKNGIATGATKEDYLARKSFISDFYALWNAANTTKHTMYHKKKAFGKIKLTVGEFRGSRQKVQYCITAIEND